MVSNIKKNYFDNTTVYQSVDILDIVKKIGKRNKRLQAVLLNSLEEYLDPNSEEFKQVRKIILDETNLFARSVVSEIFGDIEYMIR